MIFRNGEPRMCDYPTCSQIAEYVEDNSAYCKRHYEVTR